MTVRNRNLLNQGQALIAARIRCKGYEMLVTATALSCQLLKVLQILKGLQISPAKSNIKRVDLNLLRTFSRGDFQQQRSPNREGTQQ